ncbi:dipeptide ABC transporter ATP-binding protein [Leucobacter soli]|uniref:dipeptide ABC transporter ATP-binding protein n=1 Tax=Leucobacter soli TaxID=2812850 RepID=UPI00361187FB
MPQGLSNALNPAQRIGRQLTIAIRQHMKDLSKEELQERVTRLIASVGIPEPEQARNRYPHQFSGGQQQRLGLALAISCDPELLILDEPTTGVDVSSQVEIMRLLRNLVSESGMSAIFVSHDLAALSGLADSLAIMYAGEIVESGPTRQVIDNPAHPYTRALLWAAPRSDASMPIGIPGVPPVGIVEGECAFAARCSLATAACRDGKPALVDVGARQSARCIRTAEVQSLVQPTRVAHKAVSAVEHRLLDVSSLSCTYENGGRSVQAVSDISFSLDRGKTLGIIGESGSGKSTLIRTVAGLHSAASGTIRLESDALQDSVNQRTLAQRQEIQLVFQDPDTSLNPRHTVGTLVGRPLDVYRSGLSAKERRLEISRLLDSVLLSPEFASRYPHELSGGQRQRVALARAFAAKPKLLLCDEVTAALDVSVQASVLELIADLSANTGTSVIFVSHDLDIVRAIADDVMVLKNGICCEYNSAEAVFSRPEHPYTQELMAATTEMHRLEAAS